jgi:CBS domain containing-hemolysin-like protein
LHGPRGALLASAPPSQLVPSEVQELLLIAGALCLSAFFGTLRWALQHALEARVLAHAPTERARARLAPLLDRLDSLGTSAALFKITFDVTFVALLLDTTSHGEALRGTDLLWALGIAAPVLLLVTESLPAAIARARGDALLVRVLPTYHYVQLPIAFLVGLVHAVRGALLRAVGLEDAPDSTRRFVEGLREVIADAGPARNLDEAERELIENVMDFHDVDAAEVMTPRTEIVALDLEGGLEAAPAAFAESGFSRLPVYDGSIDTIIGTISALQITEILAQDEPDQERSLRELLKPPYLVPETKLVSELLKELRAERQKMAIVLDEYGGTAGLVTMTDVVAEIVGEIVDEDPAEAIRALESGVYEVPASLHVSEVNEALGLDLPEEADFETLGGFVLAQLGRLPKIGESFTRENVEYAVAEASDRRVLKVTVSRSA